MMNSNTKVRGDEVRHLDCARLLSWSFCLVPSAQAGDWPQFRGPGGAGVADDTGLPTTWDVKAGTNVRWRADLPARGVSCPVIAKGKVYVTCCSGYRQDRLHVLCFDAATGKQLWERQFTATGSTNCHPKTSMAGATPVTDGERVFALFGTGDLAALDADGNLLWYRAPGARLPDDHQPGRHGRLAGPVEGRAAAAAGERRRPVVRPGPGREDRQEPLEGRAHPRHQLGARRWCLPHGDRAEVLFQSSNELTAYDVLTGEKRWAYKGGAGRGADADRAWTA